MDPLAFQRLATPSGNVKTTINNISSLWYWPTLNNKMRKRAPSVAIATRLATYTRALLPAPAHTHVHYYSM